MATQVEQRANQLKRLPPTILRGQALTMSCVVAYLGLGTQLQALIDTRAGGDVFVHHRLMKPLEKRLGLRLTQVRDYEISGYNNKPTDVIRFVAPASVEVNGRHFRSTLIFYDTGRHDVFIGQRWLEKSGALVDCRNYKLAWRTPPAHLPFSGLRIPYQEILCPPIVDRAQQDNADRIDAMLVAEDAKRQWIPPPDVKILVRTDTNLTPAQPSLLEQDYRQQGQRSVTLSQRPLVRTSVTRRLASRGPSTATNLRTLLRS